MSAVEMAQSSYCCLACLCCCHGMVRIFPFRHCQICLPAAAATVLSNDPSQTPREQPNTTSAMEQQTLALSELPTFLVRSSVPHAFALEKFYGRALHINESFCLILHETLDFSHVLLFICLSPASCQPPKCPVSSWSTEAGHAPAIA